MAGQHDSHAAHGHARGDGHGQDHAPGSMDITVQEKTFAGFVHMVTWGAGIAIVVLVFLALANS